MLSCSHDNCRYLVSVRQVDQQAAIVQSLSSMAGLHLDYTIEGYL